MMFVPILNPGHLAPQSRVPSMGIGDRIAAIPWVYEGLQRDVTESCLISPCIGTDWTSTGSVERKSPLKESGINQKILDLS